jgi:hypothetical protein
MPHDKLKDAEMKARRVMEKLSKNETADLADALHQVIRVLDGLLQEQDARAK